jgi:biopolymer transport protein ExbD
MMRRGLRRKSRPVSEIPSSSLADMAFLLLIFFMVSTTFRKEEPRDVVEPEAESTQRFRGASRDVVHLYIERDGGVYINDARVPVGQVRVVAAALKEANPALFVVIRADQEVAWRWVHAVQTELQAAGATRVAFYTTLERRLTEGGR